MVQFFHYTQEGKTKMVIYTTLANYGTCPCWKIPVTVIGKYREKPDGTWSFYQAQCPIIENSKLPRYEQDPNMRMMACRDRANCPLYNGFQPSVTEII